MVLNKKGGNKAKKQKKTGNDEENRKLILKDEVNLQEYAQITKVLGNGRFEVNCFDGKTRLANIRGSMRRKVWVKTGDVIIVSLREYQDGRCDIIYLYKQKEVRTLKKMGEIPESVNEDLMAEKEDTNIGFEFKYDGEDDDEEEVKKEDEDFKENFEENFEAI